MSGSFGEPIVPTEDTNADVFAKDVIGKKSDTTAGTSLMSKIKSALLKLEAPPIDTAGGLDMREVVGNKSDTVAGTSIVGLSKAVKAKTDALPTDPADQSAVESAITAAHSTTNGKIDVVDGFHDIPTADSANNAQMRDVIGNKSDTGAGTSIMAACRAVTEALFGMGIPFFPPASQAGDGVSFAEVIRYISDHQLTHTVIKAIPNMAGYDSAAIFSVSGSVMVRVIGMVGASAVTCTSATTTLSVGIQDDTDILLPATTIDNATKFGIGNVWTSDIAQTRAGLVVATPWVAINNASIYLTRSVDDITAGEMEFVCEWKRITSNGSVTPA